MKRCVITDSPEGTYALGRSIGERARSGLVVALVGQLGAGKTLLTRGLHHGLGLPDGGWGGSPTFVLATRYSGSPPLLHADLYRLAAAGEVADLGIEDALADGAVVVVEWADRLADALPPERLTVTFEVLDEHRRAIEIEAVGPAAEGLLAELSSTESCGGAPPLERADSARGPEMLTSEGGRWP